MNYIPNARIAHYWAKFHGIMDKFKAGTYTIEPGDTMPDIFNKFVEGKAELVSVTIPEGQNIYQIGKILQSKGICSYQDFITAAKSKELLNEYSIDAPSFEGYLFPETYFFSKKTPANIVINKMNMLFNQRINQLDFSNSFLNQDQVITLASVVEKETGAKFERKTIAGVFINRLRKNMRLQSDPTTIYGIYENFNGNLRKKDLLEKTPYNTYKIKALPIGPISNPSLAAIKAVLAPEKHNYLYFVSKNDGTHVFTSTYKEHQKAVNWYQKRRGSRKGKSWRNLKQK
jgi:UPF0755 protein